MKKRLTLTFIAMTLIAAAGAQENENPHPLLINNTLTADEISAGLLTPEVMWKMGRIGEFVLSPDGSRVVYSRTDYNMAENRGITTLWIQDIDGGEPRRLTDNTGNASNPRWSGDGRWIYFLNDRSGSSQIWSVRPDGTGSRRLTDMEKDIENFGIAPSGNRIFYIQRVKVETRASSEIYPDLDKSKALVYDKLMVRHWNRWTDGTHLHIFVADFDGDSIGAARDIMPGEPWDAPMAPYFDAAEIAWNNAGTMLAYTCKKMTGTSYALSTDSDIYVYDVVSGLTANICKPAGAGESVMPGYDKYPIFSPDDSKIAFQSMRRPANESDKERLMVYDCRTAQIKDLTAGFDYNAANLIWSGNEEIMFIAPYLGTHQLCSVDMEGNVTLITGGDHDINHAEHQNGVTVVSRTRLDRATELFTVNTSNGKMSRLTDINGKIYDNIRMGAVEKRWVTTTDGKQMLTWVVFPPDFDPAKKYPLLLYCQGGPQSVVSQFWSYRWNLQLMAARGYIVVAPNRRGLPSFGQEWLDQISGDYSGQNICDLLSAIDELAREEWADDNRMGCVGASYGGYSSFYIAGVHEKRFKAFIAHCGIFNFESMYGTTEELFFTNNDYGGPYWSDSPVAKRSYANSPHTRVRNWDTPILIVTGLNDFRVPYSQSLEAFTAAQLMGVDSRLVAFEDEAHQVFKPQNSLAWNREFFGWLDKYLAE